MVEERPSSPKFFTVTSFFLVVLVLQFSGGRTVPQNPNDQYQANIYIPQAPTDFSHPSEAGREYSQPTAPAVNQVPLQEEHHNERPDYETQHNEEDYINPSDRPRGRPYAGSFAEELDGATGEEDPEKSIPGSPEQDYPVFEEIPRTSFSCRDKPVPAYYADVEARCQVFHICDVGGHKHSFLCPNGSVFNQKYLVCDWWYDFACENAENLFSKQLLDATTTTPNDRQTFSNDRQTFPNDRQTFSNDRQTFSDAAQTFSNDGQLIYSQSPTGDYSLNQGFLNPGLPQTQLDTPQQVYTGNYYVPQNDIFHGAETGFPGRDLIHANSENARKNDENNVNNTGNVNTNIEGSNNGNYNHQNNNNVANLNTGNENLNNGNVNNNANLNNGNVNNANSNNGEFNIGNFNNGNANNGNLNHENVNIGNYNNDANSNNGNLNYGGNFNNGNANFNTRDLNGAGSNQGNLNNENLNNGNVNNLNNENFKAGSYNKESLNSTYNNQNVNKNGEQIYNTGNSNSKNQARSYIESKNLDNFQNRQDEPPRNRKQYKIGRRRHDNNSKLSTTQSSLNTGEKIPDKTQVYPEKVHSNPVGTSVGEIHEQGPKNIVNDTVALQRNNGENNYYNNEQRTESNGNSFQANVNSFNQPQPNTQYVPPSNTFREANNNFQTNQYTV